MLLKQSIAIANLDIVNYFVSMLYLPICSNEDELL